MDLIPYKEEIHGVNLLSLLFLYLYPTLPHVVCRIIFSPLITVLYTVFYGDYSFLHPPVSVYAPNPTLNSTSVSGLCFLKCTLYCNTLILKNPSKPFMVLFNSKTTTFYFFDQGHLISRPWSSDHTTKVIRSYNHGREIS